MYNKAQAIKDGQAAMDTYNQQATAFGQEAQELALALERIAGEVQEAHLHLAERLLPRPDRNQIEHICAELDDTRLQGMLLRAERRLAGYHARLVEIDRDPSFQDRLALTDPHTGTYTLEYNRAKQEHDDQSERMAIFDFKAFQWLYHNGFHLQRQPSGFQKFMRVITLTPLREKSALAKVKEQFGDEDFVELAKRYSQLLEVFHQIEQRFDHWRDILHALQNLVEEHHQLERSIEDHDRNTLAELHGAIGEILSEANLLQIHNRIRPAARPMVARIEALRRKIAYFQQMQRWVEKESEERKQRVAKIGRVIGIWKRKPYGTLKPSKRRWLVELPSQKSTSTGKQLNWVRAMRVNMTQFSDFVGYSILIHELGAALLPYDAFSMHALAPVPPESFTRNLFADIDLFRETYHYEHGSRRAYRCIADHSESYVETDWEIWDEDDYYESEAAEALAADYSDGDDMEGDQS